MNDPQFEINEHGRECLRVGDQLMPVHRMPEHLLDEEAASYEVPVGEVVLLADTLRDVNILLPTGAYYDTLPYTLPPGERFVGVKVYEERAAFSEAYKSSTLGWPGRGILALQPDYIDPTYKLSSPGYEFHLTHLGVLGHWVATITKGSLSVSGIGETHYQACREADLKERVIA